MSTHDLKLQQSTRQREEKASVASVVSNQDRYYTRTNKANSQNVSRHEKLLPAQSAQHIHNKKESESKTTATSVSQHLTGQQTSSKDLQIKKIILLKSDRDSSKISEDQRESTRFTTVFSLSLPPKRNKKDIAEDIEERLQNDTDIDTHETARKTANQRHTELKERFSKTETCNELFQDGDGPKAPFDEGSFSTLQSQHGYTTTKQGRDTGILHKIGHCEQTIIAHDSQRHSTQSVCMIQTEVNKGANANKDSGASDCIENVSTTLQNHSNLTSSGKDSGLKPSTEVFACLSLASFHTTLSESTSVPEQNLLNPSSAMLASAMVSVLASPWSGHVGRPKQGGNEVEHEPQDCRQNANLSTSLRQERRQQLFIASQRQQVEHMFQEPNDRQLTARTSHSSPEWQKENSSPNITTTVQSKRAIMKSSSTDTYRATMYNSTELHRDSTPLDSGQVPKSPHSEEYGEYRMSKTKAQNEPFKSLSSMPTTSSLLLSLRRANLRRLNAETTQMQTPTTRPVRSLTLPSRCIGKNAQSYASSSTPDDQAGDTIVSYTFLDTTSKTEGISDTSPFPFSHISKRIVTRTPLFQNKTEISKNPETFITRTVEQQFPNFKTKSSPPETLKPQLHSHSSIPLKKYSSTEGGDQVELSIAYNTNQQNNINNNQETSQISKTNANMDVSQTGLNGRNLKSQSKQNIPCSNSMSTRTFTDNLNFSPRKGSFSVDGIDTINGGKIILDYEKKSSQSSHSPMDLSSPLSPRRPLRDFRVPSIYSYLRESSPAVSSPSSPSTPFSHIQRAKSSSSPMQGGVEILQSDRKTPPSRFSFDISPLEPPAQSLNKCSSSSLIGPAQSLPPDFGRKSAPRLSTSPYSTLISSRHALNSTLQKPPPSPPAPQPQEQFTSNDTTTIYVYPIKNTPSGSPKYKSILKKPKEQLGSPDREQKTSTGNTIQAYSGALGNDRPAQPYLSQTLPNASFVMESQSANITPHPKRQQNTCFLEEHNGSMTVQLNKDNSYPKQTLSQKENAVTTEIATDLHMHERLQEIPNSKKGLFTLRVKKDNVFTSDSVADKDVVTPQYFKTKRNLPVFKTGSRIEQMLTRLKQTFGGKRSDNTLDTKIGKTVAKTSLHTKTFERDKKEEKRCSESQWEPSPINDKASFKSLSRSALMKTENTLNADVLPRVQDEKKHLWGQWEVPNTSVTTDKEPLSSSESLSPLAFSKVENTLNVDGQSRVNGEKTRFRSQWDAPNSYLITDKASLPSSKSLSPLTFRKSENTLNLYGQSRVKGEKTRFGSQWETPNSSQTIDNASLPSSESLSPCTFRKTEKTLNVHRQKRWSDENGRRSYSSNSHWQKPHVMNRSATLPHYRNSSVGPPSPFYLFDYDSEDIQNDSVFYSPVGKKSNSLCESDNFLQLSTAKSPVHQNLIGSHLSSSCANLKYGLSNGRSFSVSSVFSSRPSGPGRISTSSVSDLSSLDSRFDTPINISFSPTYGSKSVTNNQSQPGCTGLLNPDEQENSSCFWDDADPTPPPSPPFSSSRRMSQAAAVSPIRTTPDSPSPHRILTSRSYSTSLPVCEESGSDTSEDEYYLDNGGDDDMETEL